MIGQLHSVVLDAPDAHALATFYAELLGMEVKGSPGDDWVVVTGAGHRLAFQQAPDLQPPDWPDPDRPQQFHLDVYVRDIDEAEPKALALGARRLPGEGGDFRVYADPVGHPFCLVLGRRMSAEFPSPDLAEASRFVAASGFVVAEFSGTRVTGHV